MSGTPPSQPGIGSGTSGRSAPSASAALRTSPAFRIGEWTCRPRLHRLSGPAGATQLEPKVLEVLLCLASEPGRVQTRAELLDAVWGGGAVSEQVLSRAVSELRKAFGDDPRQPRVIETIAKSGYRLLLPVEEASVPAEGEGKETRPPPPVESGGRLVPGRVVPVIVALLVVGLLGWWAGRAREASGPEPPVQASLLLPAEALLDLDEQRSFALSPDGTVLVYSATRAGVPGLYRRPLDRARSEPIVGGEGGYGPFFSADGRYVAFYAEGSLKRVALEGGEAVTLFGDASDALGASWGADGTMVFTRRWLEGLWIRSPGGGPQPLTELDAEAGERSHLWPQLLPDGRHLIFTVWRGGGIDSSETHLLDLETGQRRRLIAGAADARFVPPHFLVFITSGILSWAELELGSLEVEGPARPLFEGVRYHPVSGAGHFAVSAAGRLVWADWEASSMRRALHPVDSSGRAGEPIVEASSFATPQLSPDGARLALTRQDRSMQIWVRDLARGVEERLTKDGESLWPMWSPDGGSVVFSSQRDGAFNLYQQAARADAPAERLTESPNLQVPGSWSPDGSRFAYSEFHPERRWDVWLLTLGGDAPPEPFLDSLFDEFRPTFSPDGQLLAYVSNESGRWDETGRWEVYVRPLGQPHLRVQASNGGASDPAWSPDGGRLYFRQAGRLLSVAIRRTPELAVGRQRVELADPRLLAGADMMPTYVVHPDGSLLVMRLDEPSQPMELHLRVGGLPW